MRPYCCTCVGVREEYIQQLIDENARLKGEKGKPKIKPSRLEPDLKAYKNLTAEQQQSKKAAPEATFDQIFTQVTGFEPRWSSSSPARATQEGTAQSFTETGFTTP